MQAHRVAVISGILQNLTRSSMRETRDGAPNGGLCPRTWA